jgi:hypothetical protein
MSYQLYRDSYNPIANGAAANGYATLGDYSVVGSERPYTSASNMQLTASAQQWFSPTPAFEMRTSNIIIPPSQLTPVNLERNMFSSSDEYQNVNDVAKLNPQ